LINSHREAIKHPNRASGIRGRREKMQKTININGKRYTGRQIISRITFNPANYTHWCDGVYVVPRGYESETSGRPGAACDPADAAFVEVGIPHEGPTKMIYV
jgi:hypothetical protein